MTKEFSKCAIHRKTCEIERDKIIYKNKMGEMKIFSLLKTLCFFFYREIVNLFNFKL